MTTTDNKALAERLLNASEAYPEDVFLPLTPAERAEHGDIVQRASAQMGRHFSSLLREAAEALTREPSTPSAQMLADESTLECIAQAAAALDVLGRKPLAAWLMRTHIKLSTPQAEAVTPPRNKHEGKRDE